jgi:hypothetical protein
VLGDHTVIDSRRALLVWEPKRVVPTYAVPITDVAADVVPDDAGAPATAEHVDARGAPQLLGRPVYDPSIPFTVPTSDGEPVMIRVAGADRTVAAFRDERVVSHPRDPFPVSPHPDRRRCPSGTISLPRT